MEQLLTYVQQALQTGQSEIQIRQTLMRVGWSTQQIDTALLELSAFRRLNAPKPAANSPQYAAATQPLPNLAVNPAQPLPQVGQYSAVQFTQPEQLQPMLPAPQTTTQTTISPNYPQDIQTAPTTVYPDAQAPSTISIPKNSSRHVLVALAATFCFIVVFAGLFWVYSALRHKETSQSTVQSFIAAMQSNKQSKADALQTPAMNQNFQKLTGSASFYKSCHNAGQLCQLFFDKKFLAKAKVSYNKYQARDGTTGTQTTYTVKQTTEGEQAGGQGCSSNSVSTLTISTVPKGRKWLVDFVDSGVNFDANLCPVQDSATPADN